MFSNSRLINVVEFPTLIILTIYKFIVLMLERQRKERDRTSDPSKLSNISKVLSDRPQRKDEKVLTRGKGPSESIPEVITYLLMKEKFQQIYKRIEKISLKDQQNSRFDRRAMQQSSLTQSGIRIIHFMDDNYSPQITKLKSTTLNPKRTVVAANDQSIQINTVSDFEKSRRGKSVNPLAQVQLMRKTRYRKKLLQPLGKTKMSNNIKDYLSVQKISIKEMEDSVLMQKAKTIKQQHNLSNLLAFKNNQKTQIASYNSEDQSKLKSSSFSKNKADVMMIRRSGKFKPNFDLYYYRDFMWKVGFSNGMIIEPFAEYQNKIKYYVGPGNNSNLIKGILKRRPWFIQTDKYQQSQFAWTQIKIGSWFQGQKSAQKINVISEQKSKKLLQNNQVLCKLNKNAKILNKFQIQEWELYWSKHMQKQKSIKETLRTRTKIFNTNSPSFSELKSCLKIHNHFCNNFIIGNKKALFQTMTQYYNSKGEDVFKQLPLTFHIKNGLQDQQYLSFLPYFYAIAKNNKTDADPIHRYNTWIVKPGQNTNRGNGIIVCLQLNQIKAILKRKEKHNDGTNKTYILQKYIERPLLYKKRKFDLRHYIMLNCVNGCMKGYWYKQGYVRTTSTQYTLKVNNGAVHLTNDAVQKNLPDYGKYQKGNKITYQELDAFVKKQDSQFDFFKIIYPRMKQIATDAIHASANNIDPARKMNNFQIFGLDFMIDEKYDVWLIQINTNPCLETTCPVLNKIIPKFIQNTFQICIDPIIPAPLDFQPKHQDYYKNILEQNSYELVFDERMSGASSIGESVLANQPQQDQDVFDDDGQDFCD